MTEVTRPFRHAFRQNLPRHIDRILCVCVCKRVLLFFQTFSFDYGRFDVRMSRALIEFPFHNWIFIFETKKKEE